jgi:hypothetical protein
MLRRLAPRRLTKQGAGVATGIRAYKSQERRMAALSSTKARLRV